MNEKPAESKTNGNRNGAWLFAAGLAMGVIAATGAIFAYSAATGRTFGVAANQPEAQRPESRAAAASGEKLPGKESAAKTAREYSEELEAEDWETDALDEAQRPFVTSVIPMVGPGPSTPRGSEIFTRNTRPSSELFNGQSLYLPNQTQDWIIVQEEMEAELILDRALGHGPGMGGDRYAPIVENPYIEALGERAVSTFSIDVDTASYANVRGYLANDGRLPPPGSVRIEELINYFDYRYDPPAEDAEAPFAARVEVAGCPWAEEHRLVRIALKGREVPQDERPPSNLVFLLDVSGSMNEPNKLPLLKRAMKLLAERLGATDRIAIVVYAGSEGLVLNSTPGDARKQIIDVLDQLEAGGSTAGGAGITLAYNVAKEHFIEGGVNRVILCTDGDFNVGVTSTAALEELVIERAKEGTFLTVLGFGHGNLNDEMMEAISNKGNGNYHFIDSIREAEKVLVEEMGGTLVTIAKDVKIQVEFNPTLVKAYRLLGYENRMLRTEDFNDDKKDAGEIGAGHRVTALYEIIPANAKVDVEIPDVDDFKYQTPAKPSEAAQSGELLTLKLRYKEPDGDASSKLEFPIKDANVPFAQASADFKFAAAAVGFGMLLRNSQYRGNLTWDAVAELAAEGKGDDAKGYRQEMIELVRKAKELAEATAERR